MDTDEVVQKVTELRDAVATMRLEEEVQLARKRELATSRVQKAKRVVKKAARKWPEPEAGSRQ
jgi:hypothetical protein